MTEDEAFVKPKKIPSHEIGADLSRLSVEELAERVILLKNEIERLEQAAVSKKQSLSMAELFFKK